jgi:hypothetical protein
LKIVIRAVPLLTLAVAGCGAPPRAWKPRQTSSVELRAPRAWQPSPLASIHPFGKRQRNGPYTQPAEVSEIPATPGDIFPEWKILAHASPQTYDLVTRTGGSHGRVSATVTARAGTAQAGRDFTPTTTTIRFADGDSSVGIVLEKSYTRKRKGATPEELDEEIRNVRVDPGFRRFVHFCSRQGMVVTIVSDGLERGEHAVPAAHLQHPAGARR